MPIDRYTVELLAETIRMKRTVCVDGTTLSVQANKMAYSTPRDLSGQYTEVEIGFIEDANGNPMEVPAYLWEHADSYNDDGIHISDVYAYVPVEKLERFIAEHGGRKFFTTIHDIMGRFDK